MPILCAFQKVELKKQNPVYTRVIEPVFICRSVTKQQWISVADAFSPVRTNTIRCLSYSRLRLSTKKTINSKLTHTEQRHHFQHGSCKQHASRVVYYHHDFICANSSDLHLSIPLPSVFRGADRLLLVLIGKAHLQRKEMQNPFPLAWNTSRCYRALPPRPQGAAQEACLLSISPSRPHSEPRALWGSSLGCAHPEPNIKHVLVGEREDSEHKSAVEEWSEITLQP